MSFQPPAARQEIQNRKILEELQQQKKQLLLKQSQPSTSTVGSVASTSSATPPMNPMNVAGDTHTLSVSQRAALQHAHAHSVGYFITQDSSFGNLIMPVIPRLEKP